MTVPPRLVLLRHGQTEYNRQLRLQGQADIPLNDAGRQQALDAVAAVTAWHPVRVIASDLQRALQTAEPVGERLGLEVEIDARLRERAFGKWEGKTGEEIRRDWPEQYEDWRNRREIDRLGIEPRQAVADRMAVCAREVTDGLAVGESAVLVSHGAALSTLVAALLGLNVTEFLGIGGFENAHHSVVEPLQAEGHEGRFRLLRHNVA